MAGDASTAQSRDNAPPEVNAFSVGTAGFEEISRASFQPQERSDEKSWSAVRAAFDNRGQMPDAADFNFVDPERTRIGYGADDTGSNSPFNAARLSDGRQRELGLKSISVSGIHATKSLYDESLRDDGLTQMRRTEIGNDIDTWKDFSNRPDGLAVEHSTITARRKEVDRSYDSSQRQDGLSSFTGWQEGDWSSQASNFDGRKDGLTSEKITSGPDNATLERAYSDGRREVVTVDNDGNRRSDFYDSNGNQISGDVFRQKQKELEASYPGRYPQTPAYQT